jgi:hypothetical protein
MKASLRRVMHLPPMDSLVVRWQCPLFLKDDRLNPVRLKGSAGHTDTSLQKLTGFPQRYFRAVEL